MRLALSDARAPRRWLGWVVAAIALVVAGFVVAPWLVLALYRPSIREFAVEQLEKRFDGVRIESLELTAASGSSLAPRLVAVGEGLSLGLPERDDAPAFLTIDRFDLELDALGLLRDPIRIRSLTLDRMEIQIPPGRKSEGGDGGDAGAESRPPAVLVERLRADGTVLRILRGDPEDEPLEFELYELTVGSAGLGEPMEFDAVLENAKPPGKVTTNGALGPLDLSDVGASPVHGRYVFERARLSDFGGIAGTLYSEGEFGGVLSRLEVSGLTETPDFQLSSAANPIPLSTEFEAIVDGTDGDTFLTPVRARLGGSGIETEGGVFHRPGTDGKTLCLDAASDSGRIEDFLSLAMSSEPPLVTGDIRFRSVILLPAGDADVVERLVLDGEFLIDAAEFPGEDLQSQVNRLSEAGRSGAVEALRAERVLSEIRGEFELRDRLMTLRRLSFVVPGASVALEGTYDLATRRIDFRGELRLDSKLSETTGGLKSFLLKIVDPLLSRDDAGAVLPIRIEGAADDPSFGTEIRRIFTREEITSRPSGSRAFRKEVPGCAERLGDSVPAELP